MSATRSNNITAKPNNYNKKPISFSDRIIIIIILADNEKHLSRKESQIRVLQPHTIPSQAVTSIR